MSTVGVGTKIDIFGHTFTFVNTSPIGNQSLYVEGNLTATVNNLAVAVNRVYSPQLKATVSGTVLNVVYNEWTVETVAGPDSIIPGSTSFQVPPLGRWSNAVDTTSLILPGDVTLTVTMTGTIPISDYTDDEEDPGWRPGPGHTVSVDAAGVYHFDDVTAIGVGNADGQGVGTGEGFGYNMFDPTSGPFIIEGTINVAGKEHLWWPAMIQIGFGKYPGVPSIDWAVGSAWQTYPIITLENNQVDMTDKYGNVMYFEGYYFTTADMPEGDNTIAFIVGDNGSIILNDVEVLTFGWGDDAFDGTEGILFNAHHMSVGSTVTYKDFTLTKYGNNYSHDTDVVEYKANGDISITDNTLIGDGCSITIVTGTTSTTYTFRTVPTFMPNEVIIGVDATTTANNLATAINATSGAMLIASVADEVVHVIAYLASMDDVPNYTLGTIFALNFNGADEATTWTEEVNGLIPMISDAAFKLDTSLTKFGSASLEAEGDGVTKQQYLGYYPIPTIIEDMTIHWFFAIEKGLDQWIGGGDTTQFTVLFAGMGESGTPQGIMHIYAANWEEEVDESLVFEGCVFISASGAGLSDSFICQYPGAEELVFHHIAFVVRGQYYNIAIDGHFIGIAQDPSSSGQAKGEWGRAWDNGSGSFVNRPFSGTNAVGMSVDYAQPGISVRFDGMEMLNYAKWTEDFTPPEAPPVIISSSKKSIMMSTTCSGITIGATTKSLDYSSSRMPATIPSFTGYGTGTQWGELGDIYGLASIPSFTGDGDAIRSGNTASVIGPDFNIYANSFIQGKTIASTDAEIISLLLCDNDWMEDFAAMIAVSGYNDDAALVITQWVQQNITYVTDLVQWGVEDYWVDPRLTIYSRQGDCEDGAFLTASLMMAIGIPAARVRVYLGTRDGDGHAWVAYRRESDNKWVFMDWLSETVNWEWVDSVDSLPLAYPEDVYAYTIATNYVTCSSYARLPTLAAYILSLTGVYTEEGKGIIFPEFTITGQIGENASGEVTFPDFGVSGQTGQGVEVDFPSFEIHATAYISPYVIGEIHFSIPEVNATGLNGILCEGDVKFPSFNIVARTTAVLICGGVIVFPNFNINAFAIVPATHCGIRLNTTNFAPSEYDNFAFNSMCKFNGKVLCASANGIVEFVGDDDKGTDIDAYFQLPSCDYSTHKQKNFRKVFVEGESGGDLIVTAIADDAEGGNYEIGSLGVVGETQYTFQMNHSDRGSQIGLKIENKNGADFTINSMFATLVIANTLTRGYNVLGRGRVTLPEFTVSASG